MTDLDPNANALPQATIEPVPLPGEPATDRAFRHEEDGRLYRVRTVRVAEPQPWAEGTVVPFADALEITVVRLDEDGLPERDAEGRATIVGNARWSIEQRAAAAPDGLSIDGQFWMLVRHFIHIASRTAAAPAALDALLAGWSAAAPAAEEEG